MNVVLEARALEIRQALRNLQLVLGVELLERIGDVSRAPFRLHPLNERLLAVMVSLSALEVGDRHRLIVLGDLLAQVAAPGVDDEVQPSLVVPVDLDEVVAAAERADGVFCTLAVDRACAAELVQVDVLQKRVRRRADAAPRRDVRADDAVEACKVELPFLEDGGEHPAADVDADQVRDDLVGDGHRRADGAAGARVEVGIETMIIFEQLCDD